MSNNSNEKLRQDIENINILNSTKAAMEAVGLPMEKFVAFNETKTKAPVLFSTRLNRAGHASTKVNTVLPPDKGQKISLQN